MPPHDRHRNDRHRLPGPRRVPPGPWPYREFDIYPDPQQLGFVPPAAGGPNRGAHRIVCGIWNGAPAPAGGLPPHPGIGRWFYTPDHYATFIEI